jgi:hypothetical protein
MVSESAGDHHGRRLTAAIKWTLKKAAGPETILQL